MQHSLSVSHGSGSSTTTTSSIASGRFGPDLVTQQDKLVVAAPFIVDGSEIGMFDVKTSVNVPPGIQYQGRIEWWLAKDLSMIPLSDPPSPSDPPITPIAIEPGRTFFTNLSGITTNIQSITLAKGTYVLIGLFWVQPNGSGRQIQSDACNETNSQNVSDSFSAQVVLKHHCVADVDDGSSLGIRDDGVTVEDLIYYLYIFEAGDISADVDDTTLRGRPDGGVTIEDLLYFLERFELGC